MKLELEQLARCLQLSTDTLERWVRQGRIPVRKVGGLCDFNEDALDSWALKHQIRFSLIPDTVQPAEGEDKKKEDDSLLSALKRGGVFHDLPGNSVEDVLNQAVTLVPMLSDSERVILLERLIEREKLTSTGIGKGVAIPHPRNPLAGNDRDAMITTCFLKHKVDFNSIDNKQVGVLFLMVCPTVKTHLHLLSRISYCLRDEGFISLLNRCPSVDAFHEHVEILESRLEKGKR
jgi:PTS system nitrogen regulatory IIA component